MANPSSAPIRDISDDMAKRANDHPEQRHVSEVADVAPFAEALGTSAANPTFDRHTALLTDQRYSHSANAAQRARILTALQRSHGNSHIQRVMERVQWSDAPKGRTLGTVSLRAPGHSVQRSPGRPRGTVRIVSGGTQYYDVTGPTLKDVVTQLGTTEWGRCSMNANVRFSSNSRGTITRVNVTVTVNYRMPRWTGRTWRSASKPVKAEWNRMVGCLWKHEKGHKKIYRRGAYAFRRQICGKNESDFDAEKARVETGINTQDAAYDSRTKHGQTQGVSINTSIT